MSSALDEARHADAIEQRRRFRRLDPDLREFLDVMPQRGLVAPGPPADDGFANDDGAMRRSGLFDEIEFELDVRSHESFPQESSQSDRIFEPASDRQKAAIA